MTNAPTEPIKTVPCTLTRGNWKQSFRLAVPSNCWIWCAGILTVVWLLLAIAPFCVERLRLDVWRWVVGIYLSLLVGHFATMLCVRTLRFYQGFNPNDQNDPSLPTTSPITGDYLTIPPTLTGVIERLLFTLLIAFNISATAVAMFVWITLKSAITNNFWRARGEDKVVPNILWSYSGLIASLVSLLFALLGGVICRGYICANL